jgi:hypothetical protein
MSKENSSLWVSDLGCGVRHQQVVPHKLEDIEGILANKYTTVPATFLIWN